MMNMILSKVLTDETYRFSLCKDSVSKYNILFSKGDRTC